MKCLTIIAVLFSVVILVLGDCQQPILEQTLTHNWKEQEDEEEKKSLWEVKIYNPEGAEPLSRIFVDLPRRSGKLEHIWGLELNSEGLYTLPAYVNEVQGGSYHAFGYIAHSHSSLPFEIYDYTCPADEDCACNLLYAPICGEDGKTYENQCRARCSGVLKIRDGECR